MCNIGGISVVRCGKRAESAFGKRNPFQLQNRADFPREPRVLTHGCFSISDT
jgi:hypothetical protein